MAVAPTTDDAFSTLIRLSTFVSSLIASGTGRDPQAARGHDTFMVISSISFEFNVLHAIQNVKKMPSVETEGMAHQITWFCSMRTS
jgi:hypothetical protein